MEPARQRPLGVHALTPRAGAARKHGALSALSARGAKTKPSVDISQLSDVRDCVKAIKELGRTAAWAATVGSLRAMRERTIPPDAIVYGAVLGVCGRSGRWEEATSVLDDMKAHNLQGDVFGFTGLINACAKAEQWESALQAYGDMVGERVDPNLFTFSVLINAFEKAQQWQLACAALQESRALLVVPDVIAYSSALGSCGTSHPHVAELILDDMRRTRVPPDIVTCTSAIRSCDEGGQWEIALGHFAAGCEAGFATDAKLYRALLCVCRRAAQWPLAFGLLSQMMTDMLRPNKDIFDVVIGACTAGAEWEKSVVVLERMRRMDAAPDDTTVGLIVGGCEKALDWEAAFVLLADLEEPAANGVVPYSAAVSACAKSGAWPMALEAIDRMRERKVEANILTYNGVISALEAGVWEVSLAFLAAATKAALHPSRVTYNGVLRCAVGDGRREVAAQLLEDMKQVHGITPNAASYGALLWDAADRGDWVEALGFLQQMQEREVERDVVACNAIVKACARAGRGDCCRELLQSMRQSGPTPTASTYQLAMQGSRHNPDLALRLLEDMTKAKLPPSVNTHNAAMAACSRGGRWDLALDVLEDFRRVQLDPDIYSYNTAIAACGSALKWEGAIALMERVRRAGLLPTIVTFDSLISACEKSLQWQLAFALLPELQQEHLQPTTVTYSALISTCSRLGEWDWALTLFEKLRTDDLAPNAVVYGALISSFADRGEWKVALAWLAEAEQQRLAGMVAYNAVINACAKAQAWPQALHLLWSASPESPEEQDGPVADAVSYSTVIAACERARQWPWCLHLLGEMQRRQHHVTVETLQAIAWAAGHGEAWQAALAHYGELVKGDTERSEDDCWSAWAATTWACEANGATRPEPPGPLGRGASKQASVLEFVKRFAKRGDLDGVIDSIEEYAKRYDWLKVAGGPKARLLEGCLQCGDAVIECGTFVGYSALVMARQLRKLGGGSVTTVDVDAASACIARQVIEWAGAEDVVTSRIGRANDWLTSGKLGKINVLVLDHRGTMYHEDLKAAESSLVSGARVIADNVLLPGAPLFLSYALRRFRDMKIYDVPEFLRPGLDDWVVVCEQPREQLAEPTHWDEDFERLSKEIDAISWRSMREAVDWQAFQRYLSPILRRWRTDSGL
eukprot:TRINITY_DN73302_c0_g1_i1.p1 TRINITY_DN73302_c0_g1~~TRINITY_DN73302_c0_g1_i1.p1  ORF type:complete len:1147 (-),score=266.32 TRINITY_DN73302_c0_g1_i1:43-3483(-)